jgi:hypothetical protein
MHITPEIVRAAYDYLRTTPPFKRWSLPPADEVEIRIMKHPEARAWCVDNVNPPVISVSETLVGRTQTLIETLAHEMVHIYLNRKGVKAHHGSDFKRCAASVCKQHGFDPLIF